jgi:cell division protein FtsL
MNVAATIAICLLLALFVTAGAIVLAHYLMRITSRQP